MVLSLKMSFVNLKMALARFTIIISIFICKQGAHGQQSGLMSVPSVGQSNLNQVVRINQENCKLNQNGHSSLKPNLNVQTSPNFQNPSPTMSTQSTLSLQQPQRPTQPITLQLAQIPNFQQAINVQPSLQFESSFLQQPPQQSTDLTTQNLPQSQNVYRIPVGQQIPVANQLPQSANLGDYGLQQPYPISSPIVTQIPARSSQGVPNSSYLSSMPSTSTAPFSPCTDNTNNLRPNYIPVSTSGYSFVEVPPNSVPYSTSPAMAILSTPTPIPLATHSVIPYANDMPHIIESPLRIANNFFIEDESEGLNKDTLTSLVLAILQPKKSTKSAISSDLLGNSYLSSYLNRGSKPSTIKSLLPLILEILSDRDDCGCHDRCETFEKNKRSNEDSQPHICDGYSKKRDYSLKEEMFQKDGCADNTRMIREQNKSQKLKNTIPVDSCEDDSTEYSDCSEEDED